MKKITIIFTTSHSDTLGNACRLEMVRYLTTQFEATIVTNRKGFIENQFDNCRVVDFVNKGNRNIPILSDLFSWKNIATIVNKINSDFVFMFDDTSPVTLWLKRPVFQYVHQYGRRSDKSKNLVKKVYKFILKKFHDYLYIKGLKKSSAVFVVSKPIIELLKSKGVKNLIHTPHGMDLVKFQKPLLTDFHKELEDLKSSGIFIITYTGWVTENRGFRLMMDSIKKIAQKENKVALVIAGADNHFSKKIAEFAEQNNLKDNIINFGVIDVSLIPGILYYSDICLSFLEDVPAYRVSPPQKVIEYFAAGKPVICNKIQTHDWLVKDGVNGFITEYNADDVSSKILTLIRDKALLKTMSQNALEESKKHDIDIIYGNMVNKIKEELNEYKKKTKK